MAIRDLTGEPGLLTAASTRATAAAYQKASLQDIRVHDHIHDARAASKPQVILTQPGSTVDRVYPSTVEPPAGHHKTKMCLELFDQRHVPAEATSDNLDATN